MLIKTLLSTNTFIFDRDMFDVFLANFKDRDIFAKRAKIRSHNMLITPSNYVSIYNFTPSYNYIHYNILFRPFTFQN